MISNNQNAKKKNSIKTSIAFPLIVYWIGLIVWQLVLPVSLTRTPVDILFKICLLVYLFVSFFVRTKSLKTKNLFLFFVFAFCLCISFSKEILSINILIYYSFIVIFVFLVFIVGNDNRLSERNYRFFLKSIIVIGLISSLYAIIFCSNQFISAFRISSAYGNELMSFFDSSHVYGLYMSASSISCLLLIEIEKRKKWCYLIFLLLFLVNLILTYSRTAIIATIFFAVFYILLGHHKRLKITIVCIAATIVLIYLTSPDIRSFANNIVFKNGNVAGRDTLYEATLQIYNKMSISEKLFGMGVSRAREELSVLTNHDNTHNAFTECLLCFGYSGVLWLAGLIMVSVYKCFKFRKINGFYSIVFLCIVVWSIGMMLANTFVVFTSSVDCFFLTVFAIVTPKYVMNGFKRTSNLYKV